MAKKGKIIQKKIEQKILQEYYLLRTRRSELEAQAREVKKEEEKFSTHIKELLEKGVAVENGTFTAVLEAGGRYPAWKQEFIKRLGEDAALIVEANTPRRISLKVEVSEDIGCDLNEMPNINEIA